MAVFAIMLVSVTSVFAKEGRVNADDFTVIPGVYECGSLKFEFWETSSGYINWTDEYGESGTLDWLGVGDMFYVKDKYGNFYNFEAIDRTTLKSDKNLIYSVTKTDKGTELLLAIFMGWSNSSLFKRIDDGAYVTCRACGTTPLHEAARTGNFPLARKIVEKNASTTNEKDKDGKTPADVAKQSGYTELAKYFRQPLKT